MIAASVKKAKDEKQKKQNKSKSINRVMSRRCVLAEKMRWDTLQVTGKNCLIGKETHQKKSCRATKIPHQK